MKTARHIVAAAIAERTLQAGETSADLKLLGDEIAAYLMTEHRIGELDSVLRDIMQYRSDKGVVEVVAVSAFPLSATSRADITEQVHAVFPNAREIIISEQIDLAVVAGVRLDFANQQLDLSVRSKLNRLKRLTANPRTRKSQTTTSTNDTTRDERE